MRRTGFFKNFIAMFKMKIMGVDDGGGWWKVLHGVFKHGA